MKRLCTVALAALATLTLAGRAAAEPVVVKLQSPLSSATKPVAGGTVFECLGDVCAARNPTVDSGTVRACRELARQVGPVASFGLGSKPLAASELSSCNENARK
jgi:hypothetical protein